MSVTQDEGSPKSGSATSASAGTSRSGSQSVAAARQLGGAAASGRRSSVIGAHPG